MEERRTKHKNACVDSDNKEEQRKRGSQLAVVFKLPLVCLSVVIVTVFPSDVKGDILFVFLVCAPA